MEAKMRLLALREEAKKGRDPTCTDETLELLLCLSKGAERILEIGAAEGLTSIALHLNTGAKVTAIEKDPARCKKARENIRAFGAEAFIDLLEGDAGEILPCLDGSFGLIFLDGPKAQYRRYFSDCKRLLASGGVLVSDDILLFGWVEGGAPNKRRMLIEHIREYLAMLQADPDLETEIYHIGEGVAVSKRK